YERIWGDAEGLFGKWYSNNDELEDYENEFNKKNWGLWTGIDLHKCNIEKIKNKEMIEEYVKKLIELIKMKTFDEAIILDVRENENTTGFIINQLIGTSLINAHFVNKTGNVYVDIFSYKYYDSVSVANFTKEFFEAKEYNINSITRK
ncbi:MAG: S-adenosylmethionine decarboxylase, partial [Candidatus Nanoarchaeia archaeon]|nr:S-adenosylmethionine decarboxylase [Candidatus Nanoarchaeia archaeon]